MFLNTSARVSLQKGAAAPVALAAIVAAELEVAANLPAAAAVVLEAEKKQNTNYFRLKYNY